MRAGFGAIEITPPMGVELAGYGYYLERKCTSVRDPLFLRAVLLEENGIRQLLVCFDLLGVSQGIADRVILEAAALGVPRDRVLIVSIHTHTGPVIQYHNGCGEVDPDYIASLETKIRPALEAAAGDLSEVTLLSFVHEPVPGDELYKGRWTGTPAAFSCREKKTLRSSWLPPPATASSSGVLTASAPISPESCTPSAPRQESAPCISTACAEISIPGSLPRIG